jgi:hypothetical protein
MAAAGWPSAAVTADPPSVYFDVTPVVACRDASTTEFAAANPDEKLIEARIRVSSLIHSGDESDLLQYFYRVDSPGPTTVRIHDFAPKTTLASDVAGNVSIERKKEQSQGAGLTVSGPHDLPLKVTGSGDLGSKSLDAVRYELVPPMTAVAASGTIHRGQGVYFKLKPSRSSSLEGEKEFVLVFRVPASWRGEVVYVSCIATGVKRALVPSLNDNVICGRRRSIVALHADGDVAAKLVAERLVSAESDLLQSIAVNQREIQRRRYPTIAHQVGKFLDVVEPALPDDWAQYVMYGGPHDEIEQIARRLPTDVREAVSRYTGVRRELASLTRDTAGQVQ